MWISSGWRGRGGKEETEAAGEEEKVIHIRKDLSTKDRELSTALGIG
jgi:hypothetical protein